MIGRTLSHYKVLEEISRGGMGIVYRAVDLKLDREVALKVLPPELVADPDRKRRFVQEAKAAAKLDHPHIGMIFEIDETEGITFIAMELIEGEKLKDLITEEGLPVTRALDLATEVAEGLARAHDKGIVHRDIKPANIMVNEDDHAKIIDFGLAKLVEPLGGSGSEVETAHRGETAPGQVVGTLSYMSPEQVRGQKLDHRSDVFSFGIVLYEMLSGEVPFQAPSSAELPHAIIHSPTPVLRSSAERDVSELQPIIEKALEKDPEKRYQTMKDLLVDLRTERSRLEMAFGDAAATRVQRKRRGVVALALSAAALVALTLTLVRLLRPTPTVAILPWTYEGPAENESLAQLVPIALSERLRMFQTIEVTPFAVSHSYKANDVASWVAQELGVTWVLQGDLSVHSDGLVATLKLSSTDGELLSWPKRVRGVHEVLTITDEVAREVSAALGAEPQGDLESGRKPEALRHYLEGRTYLEGWDVEVNYEKAVEAFNRALTEDADFAEAHAGLALALWVQYGQTGEVEITERAETEARRAVTLGATLPEAHLAMGVSLLRTGRAAEAVRSFEKARELAPTDDAICRRIGQAYAALGNDQDAERMYQRAIDLRPNFWENHNEKGLYYQSRGNLDASKALFRKVIELRPESDKGYNNLAVAHMLAGELDQAEPLLQAAIRIDPNPSAYSNLGFIYYAASRFEEAAREFRNAVDAGGGALSWGNLGDANRQLGRLNEANEAYWKALELIEEELDVNPQDSESRLGYAMYLAGLGRCRDVPEQVDRALTDAPGLPALHYYAALAFMMCEDREKAVYHTAKAIEGGVLADVKISPDLQPLLDDPRLEKLLR